MIHLPCLASSRLDGCVGAGFPRGHEKYRGLNISAPQTHLTEIARRLGLPSAAEAEHFLVTQVCMKATSR